MIQRPTVLILGAGASLPYGYSTGQVLAKEVIGVSIAQGPVPELLAREGIDKPQAEAFGQALQASGAPSVDWFLEYRPEFMRIGKLMMARMLLARETDNKLFSAQSEHDWYQYLWLQLATEKRRFGDNQLSIVTFNYDRSLERFLYVRLRNLHGYGHAEALTELRALRIIHVHGCLGGDDFEESPYYGLEAKPARVAAAADRIVVVHETVPPSFDEARNLLATSKAVCLLGFGFLPKYCVRLQLSVLAANTARPMFFASRFGMTDAEFYRATGGWTSVFRVGNNLARAGSEADDSLAVLRRTRVLG